MRDVEEVRKSRFVGSDDADSSEPDWNKEIESAHQTICEIMNKNVAGADRAAWDAALRDIVGAYDPDLVASAGFMKLLGPAFLDRFGGRTINTHPALLPSFPGMHGPRDALRAGVKVSGATVFVVDAGVDTGKILLQGAVDVRDDDDVESLHERIKVVERGLLIQAVSEWGRPGLDWKKENP